MSKTRKLQSTNKVNIATSYKQVQQPQTFSDYSTAKKIIYIASIILIAITGIYILRLVSSRKVTREGKNDLSTEQINSRLTSENVKIIANEITISPSEEDYHKTVASYLKTLPSQCDFTENKKQENFKKTLVFASQQSSLAKRMSSAFYRSKNFNTEYFEHRPKHIGSGVQAAFNSSTNTLSVYGPKSRLRFFSHELGHGGATNLSFQDKLPKNFIDRTAKAFPCETQNDVNTFKNIVARDWKHILDKRYLLERKDLAHGLSRAEQQFLSAISLYQPSIDIILSCEDLKVLEKYFKIEPGSIINLDKAPKRIKLIPISDPIIDSLDNSQANTLFNGNLLIKKMAYLGDVEGTSQLEVYPTQMSLRLKLRYFFQAFDDNRTRLSGTMHLTPDNFCQEVFAGLLEFEDDMLEELFSNSVNYLHKKLNEKEEQVVSKQSYNL